MNTPSPNRPSLPRTLIHALMAVAVLLSSTLTHAQIPIPPTKGEGNVFIPVMVNWLNMLPIKFGPAPLLPGPGEPPTMSAQVTPCLCPSRLVGAPVPGIPLTYWEPSYVAEMTRKPGNLVTLGGVPSPLSAMTMLHGASSTDTSTGGGGGGKRMQAHWYIYPVFAVMGLMLDAACSAMGHNGIDLAAVTEVDPLWQDDEWAIAFAPESILFSLPVTQLACMADTVASAVAYPLDPLFWCVGGWGSTYPLSGNANSVNGDAQGNALTLAKFVARQTRIGILPQTVGPTAMCSPHPNPIWVKSQWRVEPVFPLPTFNAPIYFGQTEMRWAAVPPANFPGASDSAYLLWRGRQCCVRP
ncbi:TraU family protein [Sinimarinibacterium sp. NLF-5-8]|uniref:TraU family protein n=1 Tax=Sinimarinibacterium sp. NLF-5-8 TaxID=2698684 RepID=UPI00137BDF53|nr:TraU family protein [Sinimarinibacterium sp. NLF-5-8]QHS09109.1 conjugal transfer protein [Sinimarinibacterium sp. NLF-5-8]